MSRYSRQEKAVLLDNIQDKEISIIGVGAIGREIALKLTQMGISKLSLIDFDLVEEPNICTQGYKESDIGLSKVEVTKNDCLKINSNINIRTIFDRFKRLTLLSPVIFCCVDSMSTRKLIWESIQYGTEFFVDTRMSTEVLRVLTVNHRKLDAFHYETTLFNDNEAYQEGCTTKATCYCASIAAGIAVANLAKWTRNLDSCIESDLTMNILTSEFIYAKNQI